MTDKNAIADGLRQDAAWYRHRANIAGRAGGTYQKREVVVWNDRAERAELAAAELDRLAAALADQMAWNEATREQFDRIGVALQSRRSKRETGEPSRSDAKEVESLVAALTASEAEVERLRAKLVQTADGVYVGPGDIVFALDGEPKGVNFVDTAKRLGQIDGNRWDRIKWASSSNEMYSTREAALEAQHQQEDSK